MEFDFYYQIQQDKRMGDLKDTYQSAATNYQLSVQVLVNLSESKIKFPHPHYNRHDSPPFLNYTINSPAATRVRKQFSMAQEASSLDQEEEIREDGDPGEVVSDVIADVNAVVGED